VRHADERDCAELVALVKHLGYHAAEEQIRTRLGDVLAADGHHVLVAVKADEVVGFLHCFKRPAIEKGSELVVQAMVVSPDHRNRGVATMMLGAAQSLASASGCDALTLHSRHDREPAHRFYTGHGFTVVASSELFRKTLP
jgi:ribosomal protein S18 acetylase RimI-like enzyme